MTFHSVVPWGFPLVTGRLAGVTSFLAFIPYVISTLRGINRPNRATWIIWTVVGFTLFVSYRDVGATETLWVAMANLFAFMSVVLLSFKYGEGGWTPFDVTCLVSAGIGLILWWFLKSPVPALLVSLFVDFMGALPTIRKIWFHPEGEDRLTWSLFAAGNFLNLFAIETWSLTMILFPLYMFFISSVMALLPGFHHERKLAPCRGKRPGITPHRRSSL